VLSVRCAFEGEGASAIAWTLYVTKSGGWAQSTWQQAGVAPAWGGSLGKQLGADARAPSLVADYKLPLGAPTSAQEAELGGQGYVLLTLNSTRVVRNRVVRALDRERTWAYSDASARRALDAGKAAGSGAVPRYLVFSQDGGVCLTAYAGISGRFDCGSGGGAQDLLGLLDASTSSDFANCDTFGWKGNEADTAPEVYLTSTCSAPDQSFSARCSRGGTCVNPTCCKNMFQSDQEKCGTRMCKPYCQLLTANVDLCGSSVEWLLTGGWVSVWFGSSRSL
jgi:hypothetical protein